MVKLQPIPIKSLIGTTILNVVYEHGKNRLIFVLNNKQETVIYSPNINLNMMFTKNREYTNFNNIVNISVKDIGWDVNYLFVVDEKNGDVYRVICTDITLCMYNYTLYKLEKRLAKEKQDTLKTKIKSIFRDNNYLKI